MENQPTPTITDEYMMQMRARARQYSLLILKFGEARSQEGAEKIIWEHGRRNHALRACGLLSIVSPVSDGSDVAGIGIFNASVDALLLPSDLYFFELSQTLILGTYYMEIKLCDLMLFLRISWRELHSGQELYQLLSEIP